MRRKNALSRAVAALFAVGFAVSMAAQEKQKPTVQIPQPGVPQVMTLEGQYVRAAYNNEGYVILGYRTANQSVGDEWLLLEVGATLRDGVRRFNLTREAISLETSDGTKVPLPTIEEYRQVDLRALDRRASVVRDSINYFPPTASQACRIGFFAETGSAAMAWNRIADRDIDAVNPRTKMRAIPAGLLSLRQSTIFFYGSCLVFFFGANAACTCLRMSL